MPPATVKFAVPFASPLHKISVPVMLAVSVLGCVIVTQAVTVQPLSSVTVTQNVPAGILIKSCHVWLELHV
ncbi:hypothetical protein ES703_90734 [subsurface metagenome]